MRFGLLRLTLPCVAAVLLVQACGARLDSERGDDMPAAGVGGSPSGGTGGDGVPAAGVGGSPSGGTGGVGGVGGAAGDALAGNADDATDLPTAGAGAAGSDGSVPAVCGDGILDVDEACDDGGEADGDGCSASCQLESGFACNGKPSVCSLSSCGNGTREGIETCDDGNNLPFDGCDANCRAEPRCSSDGCTSTCGDGILIGEECDDGNTRGGDGCSPTCRVEQGFACSQPKQCQKIAGTCVLRLPVIYRDLTDTHPDVEPTCTGMNAGLAASPGLVNSNLLAGLPVASATATAGCISKLRDWYSDSGSKAIVRDLVLFDNGNGAYVNRYGQQGQRWESQPNYKNGRFCGNGDTQCLASPAFPGCNFDPSVETCIYPCPPSIGGKSDTCAAAISVPATKYDGTPLFFPLDDQPKNEPWSDAKVPTQYGYNWEYEDQLVPVLGAAHVAGRASHNFHFTTQAAYWFKYEAATTTELAFTGDDDFWMFVNGKLAVDLGGVHAAVSGSVTISSSTAANFALKDGGIYRIDIFHAERKKDSSTLRLSLPSFDLSRTECTRL